MDESLRTASTYEDNADAYCEKYRSASVADRHGDPFFDALDGDRVLDAGCGPGSDAAVFADRGLDGEVLADGRWVSALVHPT